MSILRPNMAQTESRMSRLPDAALEEIIKNLTNQGQVGTPDYIIAAGEIQARKSARQAVDAQTPERPPVLAELVSGISMQPQGGQPSQQMMQLPEDQGIAALPAPNMENVEQYADGGIVAFDNGGSVPQPIGFTTALSGQMNADPKVLRAIYLSQGLPLPYELMTQEERTRSGTSAPIDPALQRRLREGIDQIPLGPTNAVPVPPSAGPNVVPPPAPPAPPGQQPSALANLLATPQMSFPQAMNVAAPQVAGLLGERPTVPDVGTAVRERIEGMKAAGYDPELFKKQREEIEKERESAKGDKHEAVNLRLIEAGLGIMGGESPYAFVNIGKGASPALKGLQEDIKDLKKVERERNKAIRDLSTAENQIAAGIGGASMDDVRDARNRLDKFNQMDASIRTSIAGTIYSTENQKYLKGLELKSTESYRDTALQQQRVNNAQEIAKDILAKGALIPGTPEYDKAFKDLTAMVLKQYSIKEPEGAAAQPTVAARYDKEGNRIQ